MKNSIVALGLAGLVSIGTANAGTVVFDTITGQTAVNANFVGTPDLLPCTKPAPCVNTDNGPFAEDPANPGSPWNQGGNGGIAQSFHTAGATTITKLQFGLSGWDTGSTSSFMVYLLNDIGGTSTTAGNPIATPFPAPNGSVADFATGILIGTFSDSTLTVDPNNPHVFTMANLNVPVSAGEHWIGIVGPAADYALWWYNLDDAGVGTAGQKSFAFDPGFGMYTTYLAADGAFQMLVETPEPATLAVLGAGLAGLGFMRRRKAG